MRVGILREIKVLENRVAMTPSGVEVMVANKHEVLVETQAGAGSGFVDQEYTAAGATIVNTPAAIYAEADMVMHVKEPQPSEYGMIRSDQILFTYLHLAADEEQTRALMEAGSVNIGYETIQKPDGTLPLLTPMSEVAGRMATVQGAAHLAMPAGGRGVLLGGVPGVEPATVLVIGGGVVGINAARMACGLGAQVYLLDTNLARLRYLSEVMPANCISLMSTQPKIRALLPSADLVIGAVLIPGAKAPQLLTRDMLALMKKGAVLVDVAIDQGGCFETSRATTHAEPTYEVDGVIHYCVANMPGAYARTSTIALTNATLPYALQIANKGWVQACRDNPDLMPGLNVVQGQISCQAVADAFGLAYAPPMSFLQP